MAAGHVRLSPIAKSRYTIDLDLFDPEGYRITSILGAEEQPTSMHELFGESTWQDSSRAARAQPQVYDQHETMQQAVLETAPEISLGIDPGIDPIADSKTLLETQVLEQVAQILGLDSSRSIDSKQTFFSLGLDSLTSLGLRNHLQTNLGCHLPPTLIFKYPTIESLVEHLAQEVTPTNNLMHIKQGME